jgi:TetR/AcrR family transcriptional regulator, transcriptional repressor for nem operon
MTKHLVKYFDNISGMIDDDRAPEFAMSIMCTTVGALMLSRAVGDEEISDKLLLAARKAILEYADLRAAR